MRHCCVPHASLDPTCPRLGLSARMCTMGYGTDGLTLRGLEAANRARLPEFRNARGELSHEGNDGKDWPLSKWMNAILGELGEAANIVKKIERGDFTLDEARAELGREFADVLTYLSIAATAADIDLGLATVEKFNEVSVRVGSRVRLRYDGDYSLVDPVDPPTVLGVDDL